MLRILRRNDGFAALIALIMVGMLTLLGVAALSTSDEEVTIAGNELQEMRAFYAAEAGLEIAAAAIQTQYDSTGLPPLVMPNGSGTVNGCAVTYATADNGPMQHRTLAHGTLTGLHAMVKSFSIVDTAVNAVEDARVVMSQDFETCLIPLFQFAIFYGDELEIAPGPDMTLVGRVHSNGDLYLQAGSSLEVESYMTAAGGIYHGRKPGCPEAASSGDVLIKDSDGALVSMREGAGWLDGSDGHWYDSSLSRWDGRVQDQAHGQEQLNLPLTAAAGDDPHKLIEPGLGNLDSYEYKSTLKIVNDTVWWAADTVWVNVTDSLVAKGIVEFNNNKFTDKREGKLVDVTDLRLERLYDSTFNMTGYGVIDLAPPNGVIYFYDNDTGGTDYPAIRLSYGAELAEPLTVASGNPVYTWGDFNSVNKKGAAIMGDAVTFLSDQWDDNKSSWALSSQNKPNHTDVNCCYLTGNVLTTHSDYSGGFENLPRFLEDWGSRNFNWTGSAVNLWTSRQARASWSYGSYYKAPIRNWSYDTDLDDPANHPPESPMVRIFQRNGWKQEFVGY
ncbi:MAG: PilX N-terminal domain-containing pilus assembly protein [bacterium]